MLQTYRVILIKYNASILCNRKLKYFVTRIVAYFIILPLLILPIYVFLILLKACQNQFEVIIQGTITFLLHYHNVTMWHYYNVWYNEPLYLYLLSPEELNISNIDKKQFSVNRSLDIAVKYCIWKGNIRICSLVNLVENHQM